MTAEIVPLVPNRTPSLEPMMQLVASDLNHVNAVILDRITQSLGKKRASLLRNLFSRPARQPVARLAAT